MQNTSFNWVCLRDPECELGYLNSTNYYCVQVDNLIVVNFPTAFFLLSTLCIECKNPGIILEPVCCSFVRQLVGWLVHSFVHTIHSIECACVGESVVLFISIGKCKQQKRHQMKIHIHLYVFIYTYKMLLMRKALGESAHKYIRRDVYKPFLAPANGFEALVMLLSSWRSKNNNDNNNRSSNSNSNTNTRNIEYREVE